MTNLPIEVRVTAEKIAREEMLLGDLVPARFFTFTVPAALYEAHQAVTQRIANLYRAFDETHDDAVVAHVETTKQRLRAERASKARNMKHARLLREKIAQGDFEFV